MKEYQEFIYTLRFIFRHCHLFSITYFNPAAWNPPAPVEKEMQRNPREVALREPSAPAGVAPLYIIILNGSYD